MNAQEKFLVVNGLIVTLVVLSFFLMRKGPRPPVKLDLTGGTPETPKPKPKATEKPVEKMPARVSTSAVRDARPPGWSDYKPRARGPQADPDADTSPGRAPTGEASEDTRGEISLNVLFNWNGHTWDAYEVLGLPAGSSHSSVIAAFQAARAKTEPENLPFLQAAHDAILRPRRG